MPADLADRADFDNAERGLIARLEPGVIKNAEGGVVWDIDAFGSATHGECPDTVHRSLWRQSQLTAIQGLFEVTGGIYQVRGAQWADQLLHDQVAFIPPSAWEGRRSPGSPSCTAHLDGPGAAGPRPDGVTARTR